MTYVLTIAVKTITRGIKAKENSKMNLVKEKNLEKEFLNVDKNENSPSLVSEIQELNKLYDDGILNDEEFKKAKEKILK